MRRDSGADGGPPFRLATLGTSPVNGGGLTVTILAKTTLQPYKPRHLARAGGFREVFSRPRPVVSWSVGASRSDQKRG